MEEKNGGKQALSHTKGQWEENKGISSLSVYICLSGGNDLEKEITLGQHQMRTNEKKEKKREKLVRHILALLIL